MRFTSFLLLILLFSLRSYSKKIEVCPDCLFKSIKSGIEEASNGDVVIVENSVYYETNIIISKSIRLKGKDFPVVDGKNSKDEIFIIEADSVEISGFQIRNIAANHLKDLSGIRVRRKKHFLIENNKFTNTMYGIFLEKSSNGIILNNTLNGGALDESSSGNGIHAWYCSELLIDGNKILSHRDGIYFEFVTESVISNNICEENLRYGLHFMFSNYDEYFDNTFANNGAGVAVMFSKKINMYRNKFRENWGGASYGLLLKEIYDAEIKNNEFYKNTIGVRVEGSSRVNYVNNDFTGNGWAMKIAGGCYDNYVSANNFISNSFDLALDKTSNNNRIERNYWSDYTGYDLNKDGTGDVAHRPVKLFNYIVQQTPESVILMRSLFIDLINFSEKISPVFTPENVMDNKPLMYQISRLQ